MLTFYDTSFSSNFGLVYSYLEESDHGSEEGDNNYGTGLLNRFNC